MQTMLSSVGDLDESQPIYTCKNRMAEDADDSVAFSSLPVYVTTLGEENPNLVYNDSRCFD